MSIPTEIDPETMPDHNSDRFTQFYDEIVDFKPAFRLADGSIFVLDPDGGWVDENDCYYDSQGQPAGWYCTFDGVKYFYNIEGFFIPKDRDSKTLPKHKDNVVITKLDYDNNFLDTNGCYYDKNGEPVGWKITCEDGQTYFFDLNGEYVEIAAGEQQNDLHEFDLGDFKYDFKAKAQLVKQTQKPHPKLYSKPIPPPKAVQPTVQPVQAPKQQQQQQQPKPQQKPQQPPQTQAPKQTPKPSTNQPSNQQFIYHYELPDAESGTRDQFIAAVKEKVIPKPEITLNKQLVTLKCTKQEQFLERDVSIPSGKVVKKKII